MMHRRWHAGSLARYMAVLLGAAVLGLTAFAPAAAAGRASRSEGPALHPFTITSPNFHDGGPLPVSAAQTACGGKNLAPTLRWTNVPAGTAGFAFTINDVDAPRAGGFHHWVVYNIPASVHELRGHGDNPFSEGTTSLGKTGYGGPCPPPTGQRHHYIFTVYALSVSQVPGNALTFEQLLAAIAPSVVGITSTVGTFHLPLDR
jgi:Raf kinase inhibitor-like YbhB/YbcL family protein